uniref:Uncharacterized protein n=1 Tax=Arundo donax TaxID=35708 RepID=A0A0A9I0P2_ARUDO
MGPAAEISGPPS